MTKLIAEVRELIEREYSRAGAEHGLTFHSDHWAYAVMLEEKEEAEAECLCVKKAMDKLWDLIKLDSLDTSKLEVCRNIQLRAMLAACEMIQVAAMAKKEAVTINARIITEDIKKSASGVE